MRSAKLVLIFSLLFIGISNSYAQSFKLSESVSIKDLEDIAREITFDNQRATVEKRGFLLTQSYTGYRKYKKSDEVEIWVFFTSNSITKTTLVTNKKYFDEIITAAKQNSYLKIGQEGDVEFYKRGSYNFGADIKKYQISISFKEVQLSGQAAAPVQVLEKYYSAKEVADALNGKIYSGRIGSSSPMYTFDVIGSLNLDKKSFRFIAKNNVLYLQANILRNGECEYGLKEIKAKFIQAGTGTDYFYFAFDFVYSCDGQEFKNIYTFFRATDNFSKAGVEAWLNTNAR